MKLLLPLLLALHGARPALARPSDPVLDAMHAELDRSLPVLKDAEKVPLYFLSYEVREARTYSLNAYLGALRHEHEELRRRVDVDARVGSPRFDNTHQVKGGDASVGHYSPASWDVSVEGDTAALRNQLWLKTDEAYKNALNRYLKVETNEAVTAKEEDNSDDFSKEGPPAQAYEKAVFPHIDREDWRARLRAISAAAKPYPFVLDSSAELTVQAETRYIVTSEGTEIVTPGRYFTLRYTLQGLTDDGMELQRLKSYPADRMEDLPSAETVIADLQRSAEELRVLRTAPLVEPYTGPAILKNRAAGVYFHEILGHRLEGHRQKIESSGQTFAKMLGKKVVADFISVVDDPTLDRFKGAFLRGAYKYDDEGLPARPLTLIDHGTLKQFLMSRSPIRGFERSNGHGRRSPGYPVVARMGNTMVRADKTVPYAELRSLLIKEMKRQGKPYGLVFDDISGGFTGTDRSGPQSFKVLPLLVYRVYADGRPDEAVRGVDIVGTPLTAFGKIIAAGDDDDIFNGTCGAESGWVPVSAVAPSLLVSEMEVEKRQKSSEKPPVLPPPGHDAEAVR